MVFHFGVVEIVQKESGTFFDDNGVVPPVKGHGGFESDLAVEVRGREQIASNENELQEDLSQLVCMCVNYLVFLESF